MGLSTATGYSEWVGDEPTGHRWSRGGGGDYTSEMWSTCCIAERSDSDAEAALDGLAEESTPLVVTLVGGERESVHVDDDDVDVVAGGHAESMGAHGP